jgi:hypothetical protein
MKKYFLIIATIAGIVLASCKKDNDKIDESIPRELIGDWSSFRATGKVAYGSSALGIDLANAINRDMSLLPLRYMGPAARVKLQANGKMTIYDESGEYDSGTFAVNDGKLVLTGKALKGESYAFTVDGKEMTLEANGNTIAMIVAKAMGDDVLRGWGMVSLEYKELSVTAANLNIEFEKP